MKERTRSWLKENICSVDVVYYCLCGLVALCCDLASWLQTGGMTSPSSVSVDAMKLMTPVGFVIALIVWIRGLISRRFRFVSALLVLVFAYAFLISIKMQTVMFFPQPGVAK